MSICWKPAWCECPECGPLVPVAQCARHPWGDDEGLACTQPAEHPGPHTYVSTSVSDAHTESEDAAERRRG